MRALATSRTSTEEGYGGGEPLGFNSPQMKPLVDKAAWLALSFRQLGANGPQKNGGLTEEKRTEYWVVDRKFLCVPVISSTWGCASTNSQTALSARAFSLMQMVNGSFYMVHQLEPTKIEKDEEVTYALQCIFLGDRIPGWGRFKVRSGTR